MDKARAVCFSVVGTAAVAALMAMCLFYYCRWAWWDTHEVMQDIWRTMQSEPIPYVEVMNSDDMLVRYFAPYYHNDPEEAISSIAVDRVFTWVWGDKGRIWLTAGRAYPETLVDGQNYPSLTHPDTLDIERIDGHWRIVDAYVHP